MTSFITKTLQELLIRPTSISEYTFILPSKRAGSFLLNELSSLVKDPLFAPQIVSIEDFAEEMSGLKTIDNTTALFEFYSVYQTCTPKEKAENFETFSSWAQTLLYDFNEIDRYLIDHNSFFGYLSNIQEMSHWYLQEERTALMENYLAFWYKLPDYYQKFKTVLESKKLAYQGMVYRQAAEKVMEYVDVNKNPHVFIGFNALNNAEQKIIQKMVGAGRAEIFWDIDEVFFKDKHHGASMFMREYLNNWSYYAENPFNWMSKDYSGEKKIQMIGIPKNIGQAKYVGEILSGLPKEEIAQTAVVLGDEGLLIPVLNSLPSGINEVNVTMGFPLKHAPVSSLIEHLLKMHANPKEKLYYKEVIAVNNHPLVQKFTRGGSTSVSDKIQKENLVYFSIETLIENCSGPEKDFYSLCFGNWENDPKLAVENLQKLIYSIKEGLDVDKDKLTLEFLFQFHLLFNKLSNLLAEYPHVTSIRSLYAVYKEHMAAQSVDFRGKPFTGLQLMGMLESRVLDFKNVILTSVNEGVLPSGKSSNSFIPYDLKCAYNLPTYKEKDAVYTYHFYHLMQRAKNIFLLYNTESEGLNSGEKSRFLLQLEMEKREKHEIIKYTVAPRVPAITSELKSVQKTPEIMQKIRELAGRGFSPSALTTYIRNPLDFYLQYILKIREAEEVEETVAYNTLGTVVHDTLEKFYKQWEQKEVQADDIRNAITQTPKEIAAQFKIHYTREPLEKGKNLLIFEVAKRYVTNFLNLELQSLKDGDIIKILQIERKLKAKIPMENLDFPVYLGGMVDRVDELNGKLRVIDYKTGKVEQGKVELVDWDDLNSDYDKYGKIFQVLAYATLLDEAEAFSQPIEAGIISFKNLKAGFLKFVKKDRMGKGAIKEHDIDREVLDNYKVQLKKLITEICDPQIPFEEKEIPASSWK